MQNKQNQLQKIFDSVTDILVEEDLKQAQQDFFKQHSSKFEDSDENKHEYHQIFKEYTNIIDKSLESKLLQQYGETEVEYFFNSFESNYKNYKNQDTIDHLFTFLDFENFKKTMIDYNKRIRLSDQQEVKQEELKPNYSEEALKVQEMIETYSKKDINLWKKLFKSNKEENGFLEIRSLPYEKTGIDIGFMQWQVKGYDLDTLIQACFQPDIQYWLDNMKELKEGKLYPQNKNQNILHMVIQLPMMSKRELLFQTTLEKTDKKVIISDHSIDLPEFPLKKDIIRVEYHRITYINKLGDNKFLMTAYQYQDFGGYIPKMFLNMMITSMGKDEVQKFDLALKQIQDKRKENKVQ